MTSLFTCASYFATSVFFALNLFILPCLLLHLLGAGDTTCLNMITAS